MLQEHGKNRKRIWSGSIKVTKKKLGNDVKLWLVKVGGVGLLNCCHDRWTVKGKLPSPSAEHNSWDTCHLHIKMINFDVFNSLLPHYMIWLYWIINIYRKHNKIKHFIIFYFNFIWEKGRLICCSITDFFTFNCLGKQVIFKWIFAKWQFSSLFKYLYFHIS